jgi:peptidoglycan/xylan/chitin deacetylase (PgdA/CDA1 family)
VRYWDTGNQSPDKQLVQQSETELEKGLPTRADPKVLILMYHNIVFGRTGGEYNRDLYNFEHDLVFLRRTTKNIDFYELLAAKEGTTSFKNDVSILCFDDGDLSVYGIVFPLLKKYDIKATFFIISGFVGHTGYMNWSQISEMANYRDASGTRIFSIGSHTKNHVYLGELGSLARRSEMADSKAEIEHSTGFPVDILALPFGSGAGNNDIIELAKELGYKAIRTSDTLAPPISKIDPYRLPGIYIANISSDKMVNMAWRLLGR